MRQTLTNRSDVKCVFPWCHFHDIHIPFVRDPSGEDDVSPPETLSSVKQRSDASGSGRKSQRERKGSFTTSYRYEHDSEPIFGVPKLEVELTTEHDMPMTSVASSWAIKNMKVNSGP